MNSYARHGEKNLGGSPQGGGEHLKKSFISIIFVSFMQFWDKLRKPLSFKKILNKVVKQWSKN